MPLLVQGLKAHNMQKLMLYAAPNSICVKHLALDLLRVREGSSGNLYGHYTVLCHKLVANVAIFTCPQRDTAIRDILSNLCHFFVNTDLLVE